MDALYRAEAFSCEALTEEETSLDGPVYFSSTFACLPSRLFPAFFQLFRSACAVICCAAPFRTPLSWR